jgi:ankyrin repeat protein
MSKKTNQRKLSAELLRACAKPKADQATISDLLKRGASVRVKNFDGCSPLHFAAIFNPRAIPALLAAGACIDAEEESRRTPLHCGAKVAESAKLLLEAGADPDARDADGRTPMHAAANGVGLLMANIRRCVGLEKHQAWVDEESLSVERGMLEAMSALLEAGALPDLLDSENRTPLHLAAASPLAVRLLLKAKANPNLRCRIGTTPFEEAVISSAESVSAMLEAGAAPDAVFRKGVTTLHLAARCNPEAIHILLDAGADPTVCDDAGRLPEDVASLPETRALLAAAREKMELRKQIYASTDGEAASEGAERRRRL